MTLVFDSLYKHPVNHTFVIFHAVPVSCQGPVNVDRSMGYSKVQQNQNTGLPDVIIPLKSVCHLSWLQVSVGKSLPRVSSRVLPPRYPLPGCASCAGSCSPHPGPHNNAARHRHNTLV